VVSTQENQALSEEVKKTLKNIITTELDS